MKEKRLTGPTGLPRLLRHLSLMSLMSFASLAFSANTPQIISSQVRANDPTVLDVVYKVVSDKQTVNVRALAFEDGERSFWKVVRPETFVNDPDGNPTAQNIGDNIAANLEHKLAWKVSADWATDLAKVKFEILTSEQGQLPLKVQKIPAKDRYPSLTVAYNEQSDVDIFNALLWWYADGTSDLNNNDGYVDVNWQYPNYKYDQYGAVAHRFVNRTTINNRMEPIRYLLQKMGWEPLEGGNLLSYVRNALRKDVAYNSARQNIALLINSKPTQLYVGEKAYCVIDVSEGTNAVSYGITYLDYEPINGWSSEYKSNKIVLRRCEPGVFLMQGNRSVTLTKPFYISVFPVTQRQYELIVGTSPSYLTDAYYPAVVSWDTIRGNRDWPNSNDVGADSFIGRLRAKTSLTWDLPTEAQFEYAYRAGVAKGYPNGGLSDTDFALTGYMTYYDGVYQGSIASSQSSPYAPKRPVGTYLPNAWGLYDMCGNIGQWCLDRFGNLTTDPVVDPMGPISGSDRVLRGFERRGVVKFGGDAFYRYSAPPDQFWDYVNSVSIYTRYGFRLCLTVE